MATRGFRTAGHPRSLVATGVAALSLVLAGQPGLAVTTTALFCFLGGLGVANGAVFQLVPQRFPGRVGAVTGLVGAAGGIGGFLLPFALGGMRGATGSFGPGFLLYGAAAGATAMALVGVQRVWRVSPALEGAT